MSTAPSVAVAALAAGPPPAGSVRSVVTGSAFDVVLILHVAAVLVTVVTFVSGGVAAARLLATRAGPPPPGVVSYFAPGVNWAGRVLYLVPVLGFALVGMSDGVDRVSDPWVLGGLALWLCAAALAEGVLWPAERRVQTGLAQAVIARVPRGGGADGEGGETCDGADEDGPFVSGGGEVPGNVRRACAAICAATVSLLAVLGTAAYLMVAKP